MIRNLLPYRFRTRLDNFRVERALCSVSSTKPIPCVAAEDADAELHMLVCRRDLLPAAVSLKSLLRFSDLNIGIAVTDDGSLAAADREFFEQHFPGIRWLSRGDNEIRRALQEHGYDQLLKLYDSDFQLSAKLIHPLLANRHSNIIVLDPDTAFFGHPDQLIQWTKSPTHCLYTRDNNDERDGCLDPRIPAAFSRFADEVQPHRWQINHYYYNSGLLAFAHTACDLSLAESFLGWRNKNLAEIDFESSSIWFGPWTREQVCYLVMYAAMNPPAKSFGPEYRLGHIGDTFSHFMRENMIRPSVLKRLSTLCRQLM